ncbi:hypothetical protein C482_13550 [Natrialba chahannaoensis JCM 10990]|uniref:Uncharacterized protein n=1 Tax=Natrialba chahannaoensis JCM 10990 TaxID=1227492 RepID=M0AH77_9EURY|nr:hypothetical protein [Natrialba chahannaoensis]ELY97262.1 hypothetical protein C482_13550 [Natrialba chahannaoensis JCM 10990]
MKRTLAITLTVALIGSLMFMGFAGTAAAQNVDQETGDATVEIGIDQENNNAQIGIAESYSSAFALGASASDAKYGGSPAASAFSASNAEVNQDQTAVQVNNAEVSDVTAESGDNINVGDIDVGL